MKSIETKRRRIEDLEKEKEELEKETGQWTLTRECEIISEVLALKQEICTEVFENLVLRDKITEVTNKTLQELEEKYPGISFHMSDFREFMLNLKRTGKITGEAYYKYETTTNYLVSPPKVCSGKGWTEYWELYSKDILAFRNIKVL